MNRVFPFIAAAAVACIALFPTAASAGEVRLKNGDRLTGSLVKLEAGKLTVQTAFAGEILVEWAEVTCIATDRAHTFRFSDETLLTGVAECDEEGNVKITASDTGDVVRRPLSALAALNPPPAVRYQGNLTAGGSASSGNTESKAYYGSGLLEVRTEVQRVTLTAKTNYAQRRHGDRQQRFRRGEIRLLFDKKALCLRADPY